MSKLDTELLGQAIEKILAYAQGKTVDGEKVGLSAPPFALRPPAGGVRARARAPASRRAHSPARSACALTASLSGPQPVPLCPLPSSTVAQGKVRNFTETIELQVSLRNYDPQKDKRFNGTFRLPNVPRPNLKICMLGSEDHNKKFLGLKNDGDKAAGRAPDANLDAMGVDDLKKLNKNKKLVRKLAKKYDVFLSSGSLIKQIPRLLGPGLNRAGKFPALVGPNDDLADKVDEARATVKFQMKKVLCLSAAVANVKMSKEEIAKNAALSINFLVSLLKKNWQNIGGLYVKSTMGPAQQVYY